MVIKGLPDESRRVGMDWWMEWKDRLEGSHKRDSRINGLRARL
jgi:hypothetical protein